MGRISLLSVIVSVYNEEAVLDLFREKTLPVLEGLPCSWELIFVNDGSRDASPGILSRMALEDRRIKLIHFSRNYGHEAAMIAGIDYASGDAFVCMDADLQHPPDCIPDIVAALEEGYEVITMIRTGNKQAGILKNAASSLFYKILNRISDVRFDENASDFFAFSQAPAKVLREHFRESSRFLRAYIQDIGFRKTSIAYEANERAAGKSKYSLRRLFHFSVQAFVSYSDLPLKISLFCGTAAGLVCILMIAYSIYMKTVHGAPSGYSTLIVMICFLFAVLFFLLGIIGEYLSLIVREVRDRPVYLVRTTANLEGDASVDGKEGDNTQQCKE